MEPGHFLTSCDSAFKAFFESKSISGLDSAHIVRNKEILQKATPALICAFTDATRKSGKNWEVTGVVQLATDPTDLADDEGNVSNEKLDQSSLMEKAVFEALEEAIPGTAQRQDLAAAVMTAATAAGAIDPNQVVITSAITTGYHTGFDEDSVWTFSVDIRLLVVA